ncbi:MAG: hypothetical protein JNJ50_01675 [Acidobacteria bacterium]|nr:hypothetical protein [Acidobacteriota bacterium]
MSHQGHENYRDRAWAPQPVAEQVLKHILRLADERSAFLRNYAKHLLEATGVCVRDIVDHIEIAEHDDLARLAAAGWVSDAEGVRRNPNGMFPPVLESTEFALWLRVESMDVFAAATGNAIEVDGSPHGPLRRAFVAREPGIAIGIVERNGYAGFDVPAVPAELIRGARVHLNALKSRRREFDTVEAGLAHTEALVERAVADLGPHWACDLWLKAERDYWMRRCPSGRLQKQRQDAVGIGWANIDHHTYDGSRRHFQHTIRVLEKLGYELREMLYAGELAGWGSQVLEQPVIGSTIFADVDLAPEELTIDFAHDHLPELPKHRRAGLLSELLGESILEAGLNHVAGLYDQRALRAQLEREGLRFMAPFSDFPHLYQELTTGDWAAVDPRRVDALEAAGHIGAAEAESLRLNGSIVTHLENIERNDGYKGFNRDGIDSVLRKLDPRAYLAKPMAE